MSIGTPRPSWANDETVARRTGRGGVATFGVVIPYFQRKKGVLTATLRSVAQQDVEVPVNVVIVDDSSPVPAEAELEDVVFPENFSVKVIRQPNGGPGAARNRALDALWEADFVAFLDSDDFWQPYHLSSALQAFEHGFDYYTAETVEGASGYRMHADFFKGALPLTPHPSAPWAQELTRPLIEFTVAGPISGSSALVVRNALIGETRFCSRLRTAGEDGLFTTTLAAKRPRVMISSRTDVVRGKGVNIFTEGDWGSASSTRRAAFFLQSRLLMRPLVADFPVARSKVEVAIAMARKQLWKCVFANLRRGAMVPSAFFGAVARDPLALLAAPSAVIESIRRRERG